MEPGHRSQGADVAWVRCGWTCGKSVVACRQSGHVVSGGSVEDDKRWKIVTSGYRNRVELDS